MKKFIFFLIMLSMASDNYSHTPKRSEIFSLNGTNVYYEVYGEGEPLFLLHRYTQSSKSWLPFVSDYSNEFEVYLVEGGRI